MQFICQKKGEKKKKQKQNKTKMVEKEPDL